MDDKKIMLVFGSFDPFHEGHRFFLSQAKTFGGRLVVVVARDKTIELLKHRKPFQSEQERLQALQDVVEVDTALLGDADASAYDLLRELMFDTLVLGYDQKPEDEIVQNMLDRAGKKNVTIRRIAAHKPEIFKSTLIRRASS